MKIKILFLTVALFIVSLFFGFTAQAAESFTFNVGTTGYKVIASDVGNGKVSFLTTETYFNATNGLTVTGAPRESVNLTVKQNGQVLGSGLVGMNNQDPVVVDMKTGAPVEIGLSKQDGTQIGSIEPSFTFNSSSVTVPESLPDFLTKTQQEMQQEKQNQAAQNSSGSNSESSTGSSGGSSSDNSGALVPCTSASDCTIKQIITMATRIFNYLMGLGAIVAIAAIIFVGFQYIMSRGDPSALSEAKKKLSLAIIGLIIMLFSVVLVNFVIQKLGLKNVQRVEDISAVIIPKA